MSANDAATVDDIRAELATFKPDGWEHAAERDVRWDINVGLYHRTLRLSVAKTIMGDELKYSRVEMRERVVKPMCGAARAAQQKAIARLALIEEQTRNGSLVVHPSLYNPEVRI